MKKKFDFEEIAKISVGFWLGDMAGNMSSLLKNPIVLIIAGYLLQDFEKDIAKGLLLNGIRQLLAKVKIEGVGAVELDKIGEGELEDIDYYDELLLPEPETQEQNQIEMQTLGIG